MDETLTNDQRGCEPAQLLDGLPVMQLRDSKGGGFEASSQLVSRPNLIPANSESITPEMLTLISLDQKEIDAIVQTVPGGASNVLDIYPLAPLQEGILFHRLLSGQGDSYVLSTLMDLDSRSTLGALIEALQKVMDRYDVLRSSVLWENLPRPVQVVHRKVALPVEEVLLGGDPVQQLSELMKPVSYVLNLSRAPMMRLLIATDPNSDRVHAILKVHHLICDHQSLRLVIAETLACLAGRELSAPVGPRFRDYVAFSLINAGTQDAEAFFHNKLGEVDAPTAPFGILDVHGSGTEVKEAVQIFDTKLARKLRAQSRHHRISPARLFHAAWALVVARTSGRSDVVYGTVLSVRHEPAAGTKRMFGLSVNTLPLRLQLSGVTTRRLVEHTHEEINALLTHSQASLAMAQRCSGVSGATPLFTSLLNYRYSAPDTDVTILGESGVHVIARSDAWATYPISLTIDDFGEEFHITAQTDLKIDPSRVIAYLNTAVQSLLEALEDAPQVGALTLEVLPEHERKKLIELFNATTVAHPRQKLVHELFEEQVLRTPQATALECEGESLTYAELNSKANQLARYLREKGVGPDHLVPICMKRGLDMVVSLLGILKAGGAYVPLDPAYPTERLAYLLADCAPKVLLTQERLKGVLPDTPAEVIALDYRWNDIARRSDCDLDRCVLDLRPDHLAYVVYTSGSTGTPKGVMVEHAGLLNYVHWALRSYSPKAGEAVPINSPLAFDATVTSLYCPLLRGCSVLLLPDGHELEGLEQVLLQERRLSLIKISPAHLRVLGQSLSSAKLPCTVGVFVIGGETLSPSTVELWRSIWPQIRLVNEYGPTETVVGCSAYDLPADWTAESSVPIGAPIANTRIYILGQHHQPAPVEVIGDIYVAGVGVARGYLNRPALTADRFLPDPFRSDPQARMYKTGDLGRWRADGTIEYFGRNDNQVKIRGFRVELEEIEAQLARFKTVKEVVVIAREDVFGEKRIAAYVVPKDATAPPTLETLRSYLRTSLPQHMVPSAFVVLDRIPTTPNGKLDRHALPRPDFGAYGSRTYEAPHGEVEEIAAGIWQELLQVQRVGRKDDFLELGGHSLIAMQVVGRVRSAFSIEMPLRDLFDFPTLELFSARIDDIRRVLLSEKLVSGGLELEALLDSIESMSESEAAVRLSSMTGGSQL